MLVVIILSLVLFGVGMILFTKIADEGACKMEHATSANIIDRMVKYTKYLKIECKGRGCDKVNCFGDYLKKEEDQS